MFEVPCWRSGDLPDASNVHVPDQLSSARPAKPATVTQALYEQSRSFYQPLGSNQDQACYSRRPSAISRSACQPPLLRRVLAPPLPELAPTSDANKRIASNTNRPGSEHNKDFNELRSTTTTNTQCPSHGSPNLHTHQPLLCPYASIQFEGLCQQLFSNQCMPPTLPDIRWQP